MEVEDSQHESPDHGTGTLLVSIGISLHFKSTGEILESWWNCSD